MTSPPTGDRLWDAWQAALREQPDLTAEVFSARYASEQGEVLQSLELLRQIQETSPLPALIELQLRERFGRFQLLSVLGQGSSGIVYLARDCAEESEPTTQAPREEHLLALKVLNPLLAVGERGRDQLLREARIAAKLQHEGIVGVEDSGVEKGYAWIALEYVEGESLAAALARDGAALREEVVGIALQVARVLAYAHGCGVLHRDLKPANLIRTPAGRVKLLDFGLARVEGAAFAISHTGEALGTPLYMAPEQLRGERVLGPGIDIYALGLVLLELANGRRLSTGDQHLRSLARIASGRFRLARVLYLGIPDPLAQVISRCTEPEAGDRYPDADALVGDLEAVESGAALVHGRLGARERWLRSVRRRPLVFAKRAALVGLIAVGFMVGLWSWMYRPMSVSISTLEAGGTLRIDDELEVRVPWELKLSPGVHDYVLRHSLRGDSYAYEGSFRVERGKPSFVHLAHSSLSPTSPGNEKYTLPKIEYSPGEWSWLQVAVKDKRVDLVLQDSSGKTLFDRNVSGVTALRVPLGEYIVELSNPDRVPFSQPVSVLDQRLIVLCHELEQRGRKTRPVVIYSPLDYGIRDLVLVNARLHTGGRRQDSSTELPATKALFAPIDASQESEVRFKVDLPLEPHEQIERLELQVTSNPGISDSVEDEWLLLWLGPSFEEMMLIGGENSRRLPPIDARPYAAYNDELSGLMRNARSLCVKYQFGGCKPTGGEVRGGALRTNALPKRVDNWFAWDPALALRLLPVGEPWPTRIEDTRAQSFMPPDPVEARLVDRHGAPVVDPELFWARYAPAAGPQGHAYFALGNPSGSGSVDVLFESGLRHSVPGRAASDDFGASAVLLGDLDGDETQDLAIGAQEYNLLGGAGSGYVDLYRVHPDVLQRLQRIDGDRRGGGFGNELAPADLDGDGSIDEVFVSGSGRYAGAWGSVHRISLNWLDQTPEASRGIFARGWNQADHLGSDIAFLPASRGQGPRVLVGAYNADPWGLDSGAVYVVDGRSEKVLHTFEGDRIFSGLGGSLTTVDVNGSGVRELVLM
ncbi:MAG: serine/threonine protein kinase, partial [Planctomycetota bacterium]